MQTSLSLSPYELMCPPDQDSQDIVLTVANSKH